MLLPSTVMAWGSAHGYMCPQGYNIDCGIADTPDFQKNYPCGGFQYHICFDNKTDGMARLVAKYYVKKYYAEGQKDSNLLGAAAHLLQDASCPAHWYVTLAILGRPIALFAPSWVGTIESQVDSYLVNGEKNWNISIDFQGKSIIIDDAYLLSQKAYIQNFLSTEPTESLEEIQRQVDARSFWSGLRSTKEWIIVGAIFTTPFIAYDVVQWKRKGKTTTKNRNDLIGLIIAASILAVFLSLLLLIQLCY
ncbi:hypothetical protein MUO79_10420 [Candidatus Bathyarchaeota archaeon]|nr:hypothetical protein [Candidatus Bathyarchaeota archaeon]